MTEPGYGVAAADRNLGLTARRLGRWKRAVEPTMNGAVPGHGRVSLDQEEVYPAFRISLDNLSYFCVPLKAW